MSQIQLRDEMLAIVLPSIDASNAANIVEAATACMSACATVLGILPPAARRYAAEMLGSALIDLADRRAEEILSGRFDAEQNAVRQ